MSAMVNLEVPWINIMSKMDLVSSSSDASAPRNGKRAKRDIARYLDPDPMLLVSARDGRDQQRGNDRFHDLNRAIVQLVCLTLGLCSPLTLVVDRRSSFSVIFTARSNVHGIT